MARKLPWATETSSVTKPAPSKPTPRPKRERPSSSDEDNQKSPMKDEPASSPVREPRPKQAASRTLSTSPPPGPPRIEFMREGYNADDLYMMVEDEFQSVAQTFTHHLHHAEYKRLQKRAREAPAKPIAESVPSMRQETCKKLQAGVLRERQDQALKRMTRSVEDFLSKDGDEEEERADDPWSGTSLAGLMSGLSQQRTALVGLEKIPSSTRAARGYSREEGESPKKDDRQKVKEMFARVKPRRKDPVNEEDVDLDDDDDNDLDAGPIPHSISDKPHDRDTSIHVQSKPRLESSKLTSESPESNLLHTVRGSAVSRSSFRDNVNKVDDGTFELPVPKTPKPAVDLFMTKKHKKEMEKKSRLSEIPLFLG